MHNELDIISPDIKFKTSLSTKTKTGDYIPVFCRTEPDTRGGATLSDEVLETEEDSVSSKLTFTSRSENRFTAIKPSTLSLRKKKRKEKPMSSVFHNWLIVDTMLIYIPT